MPEFMKAWVVDRPGPVNGGPLVQVDKAIPEPGPGQVRLRVRVCGVCRTDLHLAEGDLAPRHQRVTPGHEVVGVVDRIGSGSTRWKEGDRIGVPWLAHTCGHCRFCLSGRENLCVDPRFTGWDLDGGYAEYAVVDEGYAYSLPEGFGDQEVAPLLCAGSFGGSAHITAQVALAHGARVHVMTRSTEAQALALELGAASAGDADAQPPEPLDSAILFAPVGSLVLPALAALDRGGTLAIAGIHLSDVPALNYQEHLFEERTLQSVTANTRNDGEAFLAEAARNGVRVSATPYPMDRADAALRDLAADRVNGAAVLVA